MEGDDFSSIKLLEKVVQLALPIQFISDEFAGVLETLESWKRQYNPQLEGILVNYSNVSLMSRSNKVIISRNGIIIDVKATFHIFCPKVGDVVKGRVNRISKELVGCIMHDTINATIYLTDYYPDELRKFIRIERDILFEITHFSCYRSEVRVQGKITPDCVKFMNALFPVVEDEELTNLSFQNENTITHYDFPNDIAECPVFKTEVPVVDVSDSSAALGDEQKPGTVDESSSELGKKQKSDKKSKKRKLDASPSDKPSKKKRKKDTSLSGMNGDVSLHKDELESYESNLNHLLQSYEEPDEQKPLTDDHPKKKKKQKKEKKEKKSKKGKVVATGTVVKSDKKKLNKKKHSKKDVNKKSDKKSRTKKGHKKDKKKKHSDNSLNSKPEIKPEN